ncbi:hypothetical protein BZA77DRAFT_315095 [Pyronema omphalodes]|nr:hypothetical protein BZA77DRAFT_315095 [Pyronema omphalodes]
MDIDAFAKSFIEMFYTQYVFAESKEPRKGLGMFYRTNSTIAFEGQKFTGVEDIIEKYCNLPLMKFQPVTHDVQQTTGGGVMIAIVGGIMFEGNEHPQSFMHTFFLLPDGTQWYISNEVFRFIYPIA